MIRIYTPRLRGTAFGLSMYKQGEYVKPYLENLDEVVLGGFEAHYTPHRALVIEDLYMFFYVRRFFNLSPQYVEKCYVWCDSAIFQPSQPVLNIVGDFKRAGRASYITFIPSTSMDLKRLMELGLPYTEVIPRTFNASAAEMALELTSSRRKEYDFAFIGWKDDIDRKNIGMILELAYRHPDWSFLIISNDRRFEDLPNVEFLEFGKVNELTKFVKLALCKWLLYPSGFEGFGVPVLEAAAVKVPAVFTSVDWHYHIAVGIPVKAEEYKDYQKPWGTMRVYKPALKDLEEACQYALNLYGKPKYRWYCKMAYSTARKHHPLKVALKLAQLFL